LSYPVRAVAVFGNLGGVFVPRAGNMKCCISSGTGRGAHPFTKPFASIPEPLGKESQVVLHGLTGPQELEDLKVDFRHIAKMPVDDLHMCDPGVQRNEVIICIPGSIRIANNIFSPYLGDPFLRVRLGIREKL
jgi:hypothetical protein